MGAMNSLIYVLIGCLMFVLILRSIVKFAKWLLIAGIILFAILVLLVL